MTQTSTQFNVTNKALGYSPAYDSKSLSTGPSKNLGSAAGAQNNELAAWYEQASQYYSAVMNGTEPQPDQATWAQFNDWMNYAASALGISSNWGTGMGDSGQGMDPNAQGPQSAPNGAILGANGNVVYNTPSADITADGESRPVDIYSNDVNLNDNSMSSKWTSEITMDTRLNPAEEVLKLTRTDAATGKTTTYFVHDYKDASVKVNTPVETQLTDSTDSVNPDLVSWAQYTDTGTDGASGGEGWTGGKTDKTDATHWTHTSQDSSDVIDFSPSSDIKETQYHDVYGQANISVPADCKGNYDTTKSPQEFTITNAKTGKVIAVYTIHTEMGSTVNVNINEEAMTINGQKITKSKDKDGNETINGDDHLSINGVQTKGSSGNLIGKLGSIGLVPGITKVNTTKEADDLLGNLYMVSGKSEDEILNVIYQNYFKNDSNMIQYDKDHNGKISKEELNAAMKGGFKLPPETPDHKFLCFYSQLNTGLGDWLKQLSSGTLSSSDAKALRDLLLQNLQYLYQGKVTVDTGSTDTSIVFNGKEYNIVNQFPNGLAWGGFDNPTDILAGA